LFQTEPTKKLVSSKFAEASITIVKQGSLTAEAIEKGKLIDNHYYAIANKVRALFLQVALTLHAFAAPARSLTSDVHTSDVHTSDVHAHTGFAEQAGGAQPAC
jgi:hypothetical protein